MSMDNSALLVLADGTTFEGFAVGHRPESGVMAGEVVFNTALVGYQEILTDPSYAGQIITFTYPHIGNYGVNGDDDEARAPHCRGVIVRDLARRPSSWRATEDLRDFLERHRVAGIAGIDTRRLTRHIRSAGAMPGAFGVADRDTLLAAAQADGGTDGRDLVAEVTATEPYTVGPDNASLFVVAYDFGIKRSIVDQLVQAGCQVEVVPASTTAADVLARTRRCVPLERSRRSRSGRLRARQRQGAPRQAAGVRHLSRSPDHVARARRVDVQAAVRSSRWQPSRPQSRDRPRRDHEPEPQLRGRRRFTARRRDHQPPQPQRRRPRRHARRRPARLQRAVPPRSGPGPHDARYLFGEFIDLMRAG